MKRLALLILAVGFVANSLAEAAEPDKPTLSVARITSSIPEGQKWGWLSPSSGLFGCFKSAEGKDLLWGTTAGRLNPRGFEQPAREELKREGFSIAGDATDPFAAKSAGDFALGGTITALNSALCVGIRDAGKAMGSASLQIDWQVYSNSERRVIAKVHTAADYKAPNFAPGGAEHILFQALADSVKQLTASSDFNEAIARRPNGPAKEASSQSEKTTLPLAGSAAAKPMKISDAVGSVVLILSGGGHGSGFLVSSDGYLITAEHVVGTDRFVKIRWSDGLEGVGEVIRIDKRRDVALIKTDPRGRQPLALRRQMPQPGDTVFAIGAPIDPKLQNTVTRGVASANRIMDGFSFIQSDVTVDPGNSGGPLLDEQGEVLGFTDIGLRTKDAPTGLNFFVPVDDALRFLSAEPR